jgi:PAT family beta-lactamase induction signal transducer AmpG
MFGNAAGGWIADIISDRSYDHVGATSNIANLGAAGIFGAVAVVLIRTCSVTLSAWLLAAIVIAPLVLFPFIPPPGHATRTVSQAFETLWQDTKYACRRPGFVLVLIAFVSPTACFALTNLFSGMGADFHSSERAVTVLNGPLVAAVCSLGCVVGIPLCQRFKRRTVYVIAGFGGAAAALALIPTPHILAFYASGVLVYNFFQGINYTAFGALSFEVVGANNPFAATQYGLLAAAANLPISYMTVVDGHFHGSHGLTGLLGVDALSSIATGVALLMLFRWLARKRTPGPPTLETASAG